MPKAISAPTLVGAELLKGGVRVSRDYEPVPGQWYENLEEEESFRVLSVDEDSERLEIEYLDGDIEEIDLESWREMDLERIEEIDLETWHEMDLERIEEPEGWSESDDEDEVEEDEDWEEEDGEDEDEDEDEEDSDDDEDGSNGGRDHY